MRRFKSESGMSLVEVMVTVVIFSFVLGAIYTVLNTGEAAWETNKTRIELQQETRKAMDWMINDLRQAGNSSIVDVPADGLTTHHQITFKTPSTVTNGTIQWNASSIVFALNGTNLRRTLGAGTPKIIAQNISSVTFRRQATSSNIVEITITSQKTSAKGLVVQYPFSFNVRIRNT
jgi:prepilin-type N-terminal cleavage/methylation domain-containing protein